MIWGSIDSSLTLGSLLGWLSHDGIRRDGTWDQSTALAGRIKLSRDRRLILRVLTTTTRRWLMNRDG